MREDMDPLVVALLLLVVAGVSFAGGVGVGWWLGQRHGGALEAAVRLELAQVREAMQQALQEGNRSIVTAFEHQSREARSAIRETHELITRHLREVAAELGRQREHAQQILTLRPLLHNLERTLANHKQRGALGEYALRLVLENVLPPNTFSLQHAIAPGLIADAVIRTPDGLIPVDAKFSISHYQRALEASTPEAREAALKAHRDAMKQRINETAKYVLPEKGTLPFALMFVPSEAVYHELLTEQVGDASLLEYANRRRVVVVGPTTFAAYLYTILHGLRALHIEKSAREIHKRVEDLARHLKQYEEAYHKVGATLATVTNHYNRSAQAWRRINKDVERIAGTDHAALVVVEVEEQPLPLQTEDK